MNPFENPLGPFPNMPRSRSRDVSRSPTSLPAGSVPVTDVTVCLPSGRSVSLSAASYIWELKEAARKAFGLEALQLFLDGQLLDVAWSLEDAGLRTGDTLTAAVVQAPTVAATHAAFALSHRGSGVISWGDPACGADSSGVQQQLTNVKDIQASQYAFGAILFDGSVVTWGDPECGGDSSSVQAKLRDVVKMQASRGQLGSSTSTWWPWALLDEEGCEV